MERLWRLPFHLNLPLTMEAILYKTVITGILLIFSSLAVPRDALAYIDPGTGSILLQALAAVAIGVGVFWRRIIGFFRKNNSADQESEHVSKK